jgi:hypothetical protein
MNDAIVAPVAGSTPIRKPMPVGGSAPAGRVLARRQRALHIGDRPHHAEHAARHHLADAEERHREHDELDAVEEPGLAEVEARDAVLRIDADGAEKEAGDAGDQAFQQGGPDCGERRQTQHDEREILRRSERERRIGERGGEEHQPHRAERAGDERPDRGDAERGAGAALQRHLVAVDAGHHGARFARDADQHRGQRPAVLRAVVDAGEKDDGRGRVGAERERQQQRDRRRRPDPRQHPDHLAHQHAEEAHREVLERQRRGETHHQVVERAHGRNEGSGTPSQVLKTT